MTRRLAKEWIHHDRYAASVTIEWHESDDTWSPTMSLDDAYKLERVRNALRRGDHVAVARDAELFEMLPMTG